MDARRTAYILAAAGMGWLLAAVADPLFFLIGVMAFFARDLVQWAREGRR
jgi:hypothetical protein